MMSKSPTAVLLIHCPDNQGLVLRVAEFLRNSGGNILHLDQHVDSAENVFFMRVEWELDGFKIPREEIDDAFSEIAKPHEMVWRLHFSDVEPRTALFVSKDAHCLYDLLARYEANELPVKIPLIVSNHQDLETVAARFNIAFRHIPVEKGKKEEAEALQVKTLKEFEIDTVVLARYMQILSPTFVARFPEHIINIHHSFLPAFPGARPYHSAHNRGVKIIGATSHYVTDDLDEGPIIHQDVVRVSHKHSVRDFIQQGRDLEKIVLARGVRLHLERKLIVYKNKTVILG